MGSGRNNVAHGTGFCRNCISPDCALRRCAPFPDRWKNDTLREKSIHSQAVSLVLGPQQPYLHVLVQSLCCTAGLHFRQTLIRPWRGRFMKRISNLILGMGLALGLSAGAAVADSKPDANADPAVYAGQDIYKKKCYVCHDVRKERINRAAPSLYGVVGRKAAGMPNFPYTEAMKIAAEDGLVWDEKTIDAFLANPQALIPGTAMVKEAALPKKEDRTAMIAYLKSLKGH
jgi:cytochrome c